MAPQEVILRVGAGAAFPAQSAGSGVLTRMVPLLIILGVIVIVGGVVISMARKSLLEREPDKGAGVELQELRKLRDSGAISREEYEVARDALIGRGPGETPPTRSVRRLGPDGSLIAAPGFDLTGEPLPDAHLSDGDNDGPDDDSDGGAGVPA